MDDPARVKDCLQKIQVSGSYLLKLINNVLDLARIENGKLELHVEAMIWRRLSIMPDIFLKRI